MRFKALLTLHCPHCLQGPIFASLWKMHPTCPVCGVQYEREQGYFMMSIFFGYILGFAALVPAGIILYLSQAPLLWYFIVALIELTVLSPVIFRYARALWMHLDELLDPR